MAIESDKQRKAAVAMLSSGRATVSEIARLVKSSRQRVQFWARGIDVAAARSAWLAKQWKSELNKAS